jgi:imidazole glycerol-phosphate synthase subunit HisH
MITIVDYGLGNVASVKNALDRLDIPFQITDRAVDVASAIALIIPGVGAAEYGMAALQKCNMVAALRKQADNGIPILGICLGMQLFFSKSEEGDAACMDLIQGSVKRFTQAKKIPHVGWNSVTQINPSPLFRDIPEQSSFYFVHSYYCDPTDTNTRIGKTEYGEPFCSVVQEGTLYGVQFHPEKSGDVGMQVLKNFWEAVW